MTGCQRERALFSAKEEETVWRRRGCRLRTCGSSGRMLRNSVGAQGTTKDVSAIEEERCVGDIM